MRYQNAKKIIDILPLLNSPDKEVVLLGITMLKNEPLFTNLNKHYKMEIKNLQYPGFSSDAPKKFKNIRIISKIFNKKLLDDVFSTEDEDLFDVNILTIICWIYKYCGWESKNKYLDKYKYVSDHAKKIIRNKNYSSLFERYFYKYPIQAHGNDKSQLCKKHKLDLIKLHTKKPWQSNRKYNIHQPMSYNEFKLLINSYNLTN